MVEQQLAETAAVQMHAHGMPSQQQRNTCSGPTTVMHLTPPQLPVCRILIPLHEQANTTRPGKHLPFRALNHATNHRCHLAMLVGPKSRRSRRSRLWEGRAQRGHVRQVHLPHGAPAKSNQVAYCEGVIEALQQTP